MITRSSGIFIALLSASLLGLMGCDDTLPAGSGQIIPNPPQSYQPVSTSAPTSPFPNGSPFGATPAPSSPFPPQPPVTSPFPPGPPFIRPEVGTH